ncbi:MAG TPA: hypothetical protein V6D05_03990 [Stenomitos sp.]
MQSNPSLGRTTDLPCPACRTAMTARPYARTQSLVWCEACGWNLAGTAKFLRADNQWLFARLFLLVPFTIPLILLFHTQDPFLAYGLDLLLVVGMFSPALVKSSANVKLARRIEAIQPRRSPPQPESWAPEPELQVAPPRPVRLVGRLESIRTQLGLMRLLWAIVFIAGLMALTPLAHAVGPRVQFAALLFVAFAILPLVGALIWVLAVLWRDRHLVMDGAPCAGRILLQSTHMRRLPGGEWTLVSRYRYGFTDPHGTERNGAAREEGRAIREGAPVTILDSPRDPRIHTSYPACLYSVAPGSDLIKR